ncbi:MAG TPA: hypothetical protein VF765_16570 [Polyangiaceae bacterium]
MGRPTEPSHPPSDPLPARASGALFPQDDRPARAQLVAALLFGLVLVASGLYLWRRPRASTDDSGNDLPAASAVPILAGDAGAIVGAAGDAGASAPVALSEPRVLGCHDRGPNKTPPDACDRLAPVEKAIQTAITGAAACVPPEQGGGTIEYVADVSFLRHKVNLKLPRAGRSVHDRKALRACSTAVRSALQGMALDGMEHMHARYEIAVTATYRGSNNGG